MKVNLVIMSDDPTPDKSTMVEVQTESGDTIINGGLEIARMFEGLKPERNGKPGSDAGWRFIPYDLDPWEVKGALGHALQREARRAAQAV